MAPRSFLLVALLFSVSGEAKPLARLGLRETWKRAHEELQVYRGPRLEKLADRLASGRSDFDARHSVTENLAALVKQEEIPHYYAAVGGRQVLHLVVELGVPRTREVLRKTLRRVGEHTIELNYKGATAKNPYGHVAMRVGGGATYDLTGTNGTVELPRFFERMIETVRGSKNLTFGRRRNLRRFMETRSAGGSANVFYGLVFHASRAEVSETTRIYDTRLKSIQAFDVEGGDPAKGTYSCAQFLTHELPFLNRRGVHSDIAATGAAHAALTSPELAAVIVYKTPGVTNEAIQAALP